MKTDEEILANYHPDLKNRASMELKIVNKIIEEAEKNKYTLRVAGEDPTDDLKDMIFNLDVIGLMVIFGGKKIGWIQLVMGNSGFDLISDYTTNLEEFLKPVTELSDNLETEYWEKENNK